MPMSPTSPSQPELSQTRVHMSQAAFDEVGDLIRTAELPPEGGLRFSARPKAGCAGGHQYDMVLEAAPEEDDLVLQIGEVRVFLDPSSAWALDGLVVDYVTHPVMGAGFAFRSPSTGGGQCRTLAADEAADAAEDGSDPR